MNNHQNLCSALNVVFLKTLIDSMNSYKPEFIDLGAIVMLG